MRLINIECDNRESFKYSILLYLYYYNIKNNDPRLTKLINNLNPYIHIKFNENIDLEQFEKDNPLIDLFIIDVNSGPVLLTRNNANTKVTIVKLNDHRYSLIKPSISCYNCNTSEINRINNNKCSTYELTDKIKKDLSLFSCNITHTVFFKK